jgi:cyanophycin synthetase
VTHPVLTDEALFPDLSRPTAAIEDPVALARAYKIDHVDISAYLVALAAWQRGLRVTFHYEVASKSRRFVSSLARSSRGEFFSVSDGAHTHFFLRALGDLTSREISALCDDKQATKERLIAAGVPVPDGILVDRDALDDATLDEFLGRHPGKRFHVKPLIGSLAVGAYGYLNADAVRECIAGHKDKKLLIEEHIAGIYMRAAVVDGRFVAAFERFPPRVTGDGIATVAELVERKNLSRLHRPLNLKRVVRLDAVERACLADQGLTVDSVLEPGATALIRDTTSGDEGADFREATETASQIARELAVRSCLALDIPVGGVDLLIDEETGQHVVLEVNQCPMLRFHAFSLYTPSPGNRVAEAIIDYYFPASVNNTRLTRASFDFMRVCNTLKSGTVAEVTLPVLGPNWVHKRIRLDVAELDAAAQNSIRLIAERHAVHIDILRLNGKGTLIDALGPSERYDAFVKSLQAALKKTMS